MTNTLAYYNVELMTVVKSFIVLAPGRQLNLSFILKIRKNKEERELDRAAREDCQNRAILKTF